MDKTEHLSKAVTRFSESNKAVLRPAEFTVGYGVDPARRGALGIIVYAMSNSEQTQADLIQEIRSTLPNSWEGYPIYFKGMADPSSYTRR